LNVLDPWPDLIVTAVAFAFLLWCAKNSWHEIKAIKLITPRRGKAVVLIFFNPLAVGKKVIKGGRITPPAPWQSLKAAV